MARSSHSMAATAVWLAMAVLLLNDVAHIDAQDAPPDVSIEDATFEGPGCVGVVPAVSADKKTITFIFPSFKAILGENDESYCNIELRLQSTVGWRLLKAESIGRGFADLGAGVVGTHSQTTSISELDFEANESKRVTMIQGPYTDNYEVNERFKFIQPKPPNTDTVSAATDTVSDSCSVANRVTIKSVVEVNGPDGAKGLMNVDSIDPKVEIKCDWTTC